jgi:hypothetical protein
MLLPVSERQYFAPAVDTSCIVDGRIQTGRFLFDPPAEWSEGDIRLNLPHYYAHYLDATRRSLTHRRGIVDGRWWVPRTGSTCEGPRLIGKRMGLVPAFAMQRSSDVRVVEANVWQLRAPEAGASHDDLVQELRVYWWMLNSRLMQAIFREYCPAVACGQLNFGPGYVRRVPIPSVASQLVNQPDLVQIVAETSIAWGDALPPMRLRDDIAAEFFGCGKASRGLVASEKPTQ